MGVFSKKNQPELQVKRNSFDGSFQNNLTMKMGYLYPCMCQEVIGGDTFRIKPTFGLRFMPTAFPLQTKIKAHCDFFYVRNRNLWKNWKNYFTSMGPHDGFPVLSDSESFKQFQTGSLGDYLGLPSTLVGSGIPTVQSLPFMPESLHQFPFYGFDLMVDSTHTISNVVEGHVSDRPRFISFLTIRYLLQHDNLTTPESFVPDDLEEVTLADNQVYYVLPFNSSSNGLLPYLNPRGGDPYGTQPHLMVGFSESSYSNDHTLRVDASYRASSVIKVIDGVWYLLKSSVLGDSDSGFIISFWLSDYSAFDLEVEPYKDAPLQSQDVLYYVPEVPVLFKPSDTNTVTEFTSKFSRIPFKVSALPFRAYEQIYNSFYRDDRNNPLMVDGVFDPNRFIPNDSGGSDSTSYVLRKRNWEQDFLTTAMTSPQFGQAPLVGLTSTGVASFQLDDGSVVTSQLSTDKDGDTVVGFSTTSDSSVNNTLVKLASSGISINDLRGVNSLQRYLEAKMRIGLRYRDQMKSVYGVDIKEDVLDMPEFIGSVSQLVDVSQINQTSESTTDPLGSYAGQLSCVGGRSNGFQKYCDENGYIIGIISVVPVPSYSQLCPKHFLKINDPLDYYAPQFGHIGFQPIKYDEVCPLQASVNGVPLKSTFGYQRAWYDYLSNVDQIHGQFRTTLNNFILCRVFNSVPSLNEDFLTVDPESMNDVFTVNKVGGKPVDTILGQVHFDITMMRPIPRFGVPKLE